MKRNVAQILLACMLFAQTVFAAREADRDVLTWTQVGRSEWLIEFVLPAMEIDSLSLSGEQWVEISVPGLTKLNQPGAPALPQLADWIPAAVSLADFEILEQQTRTLSCANPMPAPEFLDRAASSSLIYLPDTEIYSQSTHYPEELIRVQSTAQFGGTPVTMFTITPVGYNFVTRSLVVTDRLRLRVRLSGGQSLDARPGVRHRDVPFYQEFSPFPLGTNTPEEIVEPRLWIVTSPQFAPLLDEWRSFKQISGIPSELILYPEVAASAQALRTYLLQRVEGSSIAPEFLLIVGDYSVIPAFHGVSSSLTDHPYSQLAGDDFLPDISVGRIPCETTAQLTHWLDRALLYERDGETGSTGTATVFSSSAALDPSHGVQVRGLFQSAGLTAAHMQQPQSGALPLLMSSLESNPLWAFYIGHGNSESWSSVAPHFVSGMLNQLQENRASVVVSVACATADFDESAPSFAEQWNLGLLDGGALCYIGATESTAFFFSDTIGLGTLQAVFEEGCEYAGQALDFGKLRCAESFPQGQGGLTEETIQQFVLLGDPSLRLFTSQPRPVAVTIPETLPVGSTHIPVTVTRNGTPLAYVEVVLTSPTTYPRIVRTNSAGLALVALPFSTAHNWTLFVHGNNIVPRQFDVVVAPVAGPLIQLVELDLSETQGDLDGRADRGERGTMFVLVRNAGTATSPAGVLRLQVSGGGLNLNRTDLPMPAFAVQNEDWLETEVGYSIGTHIADGSSVTIQAWFVHGGTSTFAGNWTVELHAPNLELVSQELREVTGDGDGLPEGGEQLRLDIVVANRGGEPLRGVVAECNPDHQYLHIQETHWFRDELAASSADTISYYFACDSLTPRGYAFEYNVEISGTNGDTAALWGRHRIDQIPVLLYVLDDLPQQIPGIVGALDVLGVEYEVSNVLPTDLSLYRSIWIFCGVHPNEHALSAASAARLTYYLDDGGNCYWEGADVWAFDSQTELQPYFGIHGVSDGVGDAGPVAGTLGRFTEGMTFTYSGENSFIDRLETTGSAFEMLRNSREGSEYTVAVANSGPGYRTVGSSIELGALNDGSLPSTRVMLVNGILEWFQIPILHDIHPPVITHVPVVDWHHAQRPIPIRADVQDDSELDFVACDYRVNGGGFSSIALQHAAEEYYAEIPTQSAGTRITYRLRAADQSSPQNTVLTDEFEFTVSSWAERQWELIPEGETFAAMRKRGSVGQFSLMNTGDAAPSVVLMNSARTHVTSYVTEAFDLSLLSAPRLTFCSSLTGGSAEEPVAARVLASTDGGRTFPHLLWRSGAGEEGAQEHIEEPDLSELAHKSEVVFKFIYYGDRFWQITRIVVSESIGRKRPVEGLVVVPGEDITLHWKPVDTVGTAYAVLASAQWSGPFELIATTQDTFFVDDEWTEYSQRFYRVETQKSEAATERCSTAHEQQFDRLSGSYLRRR
ncbi:MAG: hypothetical protein H6506_00370 [Calditrichaeota bacterium]|nr:hypothetical protein [Calditrichota bacterium]MCB9391093.1 hypothetical protein [Calditrichota bacterium]